MTQQTSSDSLVTSSSAVNKSVNIRATVSEVWASLTDPVLMKDWMFDEEINIGTDWTVGSPFLIRGNLHGIHFENRGTVLRFEPEKVLRYSHLSSLSRLADRAESYSVFEFRLAPNINWTTVELTLSNFPTATIYKHLVFYWDVALVMLKRSIEKESR